MRPIYGSPAGDERPIGMAQYRAGLVALRRDLAGLWVGLEDGAALTVAAPAEDSDTIVTSREVFLPHPFWPGLFRGTGLKHSLAPHAGMLWLKPDGGAWQAHCRPGLQELMAPPAAPDTRVALDAVLTYLKRMAGVWQAEVAKERWQGRDLVTIEVTMDFAQRAQLRGVDGWVDVSEIFA